RPVAVDSDGGGRAAECGRIGRLELGRAGEAGKHRGWISSAAETEVGVASRFIDPRLYEALAYFAPRGGFAIGGIGHVCRSFAAMDLASPGASLQRRVGALNNISAVVA